MIDRVSTPTVRTIPAVLAARAIEQPDRTALLLDGARGLTLAEWERRARRVAHRLPDLGVGPGDRVGLWFGGGGWIDYAIGYCAVLWAGGVAVPLSGQLPTGRIRERLDHCGATALLHASDLDPARLDPVDLPTATVADLSGNAPDSAPDSAPAYRTAGPAVPSDPDRPAEILYLSGSERPRGVTATHANLTFDHPARDDEPPFGRPGHVLCCVPVGCLAGQSMLVRALTGQATVLLVSRFEPDSVGRLVADHRVRAAMLVPSMATELCDAGTHLRHDLSTVTWVGSGSAPLLPARVTALRTLFPNATLVDHYGSTESAPAGTRMVVDPDRPGSVGRPTDQAEVRIADRRGDPLEPGQVGEVWLRSPAPARAYHADARATARTFARGWTRTADLGYLDPDGYLYLVGRRADVIRSGGLKVSARQVEAALFEHPAVAEAAVVGVPHPVVGQLVTAAVVVRHDAAPGDLREALRGRLADYELPVRVLVVDSLPRDEVGRVDRDQVRELLALPAEGSRIAPCTRVETELARCWTRVLDVDVSGVDDDFFQLGGDSLRATHLAARIEETFGVRASASLVFDAPVLAHQVGWLESRMSSTARPAPHTWATRPVTSPRTHPEERTVVRVPLSPFQERSLMWMFGGTGPKRTLPEVASMRISERLDLRSMRRSLNELAYRQEALRTVFVPVDGRYEAIALPDCLPSFVSIRAVGATAGQREEHARRLAREFVERPFDIVRGPLFRALCIELDRDEYVLVLAVDHLVSDGLSVEVLLRELGVIYTAFQAGERSPLPPVALRCSDFFAWVRAQYGRNRRHWSRALAGAPTAMGPLPGQNTGTRSYGDCRHEFDLPADLANRLRGAYPEHGATAFMAGMAAWSGVLSSRTGPGEVVLFSPMSGRTRPEFESLVGSIVQCPFFRLRTGGDPTFAELLGQARRSVVAATDHQFYPHHEFLSQVPFPAWFDVDDDSRPPRLPGLDCEPFPFSATLVPDRPLADGETDLHIPRLRLLTRPDGSLGGTFTYNRYAFGSAVVERLAEDFVRFAGAALENPDRRLSEFV